MEYKLNLVDLAGLERSKVTNVEGIHLKEANYINKSLLNLGMNILLKFIIYKIIIIQNLSI